MNERGSTLEANSAVVPSRSLEQRLSALKTANRIRTFRARKRLALKEAHPSKAALRVAAMIRQPPPEMRTIKMIDLLLWVPQVGRVKANKILVKLRISPSRTLGALSDRQRDELLRELGA